MSEYTDNDYVEIDDLCDESCGNCGVSINSDDALAAISGLDESRFQCWNCKTWLVIKSKMTIRYSVNHDKNQEASNARPTT